MIDSQLRVNGAKVGTVNIETGAYTEWVSVEGRIILVTRDGGTELVVPMFKYALSLFAGTSWWGQRGSRRQYVAVFHADVYFVNKTAQMGMLIFT